MSKIVVVGSLNMDLIISTDKIPRMGETVIGKSFMTSPGGKGANQAVAAARLGGETFMIGGVGDDIFGHDLIKNLMCNNINVENVKVRKGTSTGIAAITVKDGDNCIILSSGANFEITLNDIEKNEELIKSSNIVVVQLEIPLDVVLKTVEIAKKHNVKVILNPAPARALSDELLSNIDVITPNESETEIITGIRPDTPENIEKAINYFKLKGIGQVIITIGKDGVIYNSKDKIVHKQVTKVEVVDTTAAGDSFTGALAVKLSQDASIDEAIDFCNIVGTLTVMKKGAQTSLPTLEEVEAFINCKNKVINFEEGYV